MREYYPLLLTGAIIGFLSIVFIVAFLSIKDKKTAIGFDRKMKDKELIGRLLAYAKPYWKSFLFVSVLMLFTVSYDIVSPYIISNIEELVQQSDFALSDLFLKVALYASILIVSLACSYFQAIILQKTGQKIVSELREDLFSHIESLSHAQLNAIPVGTLVTRVTNDTNALSMLFTSTIVNLAKNVFVIIGVVVAMLLLNYELALMVLCFAPFIVLFTVIFRKFSRMSYRKIKDGTTSVNTFLSDLSKKDRMKQLY